MLFVETQAIKYNRLLPSPTIIQWKSKIQNRIEEHLRAVLKCTKARKLMILQLWFIPDGFNQYAMVAPNPSISLSLSQCLGDTRPHPGDKFSSVHLFFSLDTFWFDGWLRFFRSFIFFWWWWRRLLDYFSWIFFFRRSSLLPSLLSLLWTYGCTNARTSFGDTCCCGLQRKINNVESEQLNEQFLQSIESYSCGGDRPWWIFILQALFESNEKLYDRTTMNFEFIYTTANDRKETVLSPCLAVRQNPSACSPSLNRVDNVES